MSANVLPGDVERCMSAGMNGHIPKPIDIKRMTKALASHLA